MTDKKITYALGRIKSAKEAGYPVEALLKSYYLNLELIKFILASTSRHSNEDKKVKALVNELLEEINTSLTLKGVINKKSVKSLKPWLVKMDKFFKELKLHAPKNLNSLQDESEKIFGLLKISANKLFVKK